MTGDLFVHMKPLTPIEARVLYGVLAAWCNGHHQTEPVWPTVDRIRSNLAVDLAERFGGLTGPGAAPSLV